MKATKTFFTVKTKRYAAFFIIFALLFSIPISLPAEAAALKEEVVYVRLNNDGSVDRVYVVNSFELGENEEILDYGNYEYVQNLSGTDALKLENGRVSVNAKSDRLYYEGFLIDPELPWSISITYLLDGLEISPEDLAGKSGYLEIVVETGANPLGSKDFFESYALQLSLSLKSSLSKNIVAEGGTLASAGSNKQASFVVLPGKSASLKLAADVESFEMPAITIAGVRLNMDFAFEDMDMSELSELIDGIVKLDDGVEELLDGVFDMKEGVSDLHEGTGELKDGTFELKDGVAELKDGTSELKDGVLELKDGTVEMADGAIELADGVSELTDGVSELDEGVGEFVDGIDELYDGVGELTDGTRELYSGMGEITDGSRDFKSGVYEFASGASAAAAGGEQLSAGFSAYFDGIIAMANSQLAGSGLDILTRENYSQVLENALYGEAVTMARAAIRDGVYGAARQSVLAGILSQSGLTMEQYEALPEDDTTKIFIGQASEEQLLILQPELDAQVEALLSEQMADIMAEVAENPEAAALLGLLELLESYDQLLAGLDGYVAGVNGISEGASRLYSGYSSFHEGLHMYRSGLKEYLDGVEEFYESSEELKDGANELKDGTTELLDGVIELKDGIIEFKDGVIELRDGVIELFDGIVELHDGVVELNDGVIELHDGVVELNDGTGELLSGTTELYDGVAELKDGTGELREKTATLDTDIVDAIRDTVNEMMGADKPVKSFVSEKNGEISAVQFVMQTGGISVSEAEATQPEPEPELTFWQRLIRLLGF